MLLTGAQHQLLSSHELTFTLHSCLPSCPENLSRWQDINQAYVRLPCVLDTPSKRRRKEVRRSSTAGTCVRVEHLLCACQGRLVS